MAPVPAYVTARGRKATPLDNGPEEDGLPAPGALAFSTVVLYRSYFAGYPRSYSKRLYHRWEGQGCVVYETMVLRP